MRRRLLKFLATFTFRYAWLILPLVAAVTGVSVWLALGIALLAFGLWRASREARLASGLFIVAAVLKVFLYDLAQLEGILRALSFIGLGAVLIGIGLVYQKLVFRRSSQT